MRPRTIRISPYAVADPNGISISQTPAAGGVQNLTITGVLASGGVATLDIPRQVVIDSNGNDSARLFYIEGTGAKGNFMAEAVVGGNATSVETVQAFKTVTRVSVDGNTASTVVVGTGTIVYSNWFPLDYLSPQFKVSLALQCSLCTTPKFTVETTSSDILRRRGSGTSRVDVQNDFDLIYPPFTKFDHDTLVDKIADATGNLNFPVMAVRLKSVQVFTAAQAQLEVIQASSR
jgi:hypothetical protein